jgi:hypothetical protein
VVRAAPEVVADAWQGGHRFQDSTEEAESNTRVTHSHSSHDGKGRRAFALAALPLALATLRAVAGLGSQNLLEVSSLLPSLRASPPPALRPTAEWQSKWSPPQLKQSTDLPWRGTEARSGPARPLHAPALPLLLPLLSPLGQSLATWSPRSTRHGARLRAGAGRGSRVAARSTEARTAAGPAAHRPLRKALRKAESHAALVLRPSRKQDPRGGARALLLPLPSL